MSEYFWEGYNNGNIYPVSQLADAMEEAFERSPVSLIKTGTCEYFNIPAAFDIEVSSFISGKDGSGNPIKNATMYIWQFGINGTVVYGRTWGEFGEFLNELVDYLDLSDHRRLVIYVHNLGYEFQFIRKWLEWDKVFAIKTRRPVYAVSGGLEFRCSLFLSNYALAYIGDNLLHKYPVKKLVGNLDYYKARHSKTPLTDEELAYCINDVKVVMSYIQEKIEQDGDITKIPLTNTGYVRNYCRAECFYGGLEDEEEKKKTVLNYHALMKSLTVSSQEEYAQLKRAFMGGFTHASALWSGKTVTTFKGAFQNENCYESIGSADLTSSYPFAIVAQYFPMTKFEYIGSVEYDNLFTYYLHNYCCVFDIEFENILPELEYENPLSLSRCYTEGRVITNNGRIVSAEKCMATLTELDYETISKFYTWSSCKILNMRIAHRGYLPKDLILAVLKLYEDKTALKGVLGKEVEYLVSKGMINAAFGMMVTNIVRDEFAYDITQETWAKLEANVDSQLAAYNKNFNRFLYYGWGVWVTAHARHNLFSAILEFGDDYIYSDTDSIKGINFDKHMDYFKKYNDNVFKQLLDMCNHYKIPFSKCRPKTKDGKEKLIGVWEMEEGYLTFKTVGAKRYLYELPDGSLSLTVSGLNKKFAIPYLLEEYNEDYELIFDYFREGFYIPAGHTGKMTLTYIEKESSGTLVDYQGNEAVWHERSSIYMEPQGYFMSMVGDYLKYLEGIQYVEL